MPISLFYPFAALLRPVIVLLGILKKSGLVLDDKNIAISRLKRRGCEMKRAFTLVEILIVVAILGILAAVVVPGLQGHITEAKGAAAKDNLHTLRNAVELYALRHNGVSPGYPNDDPTQTPAFLVFVMQMGNKSFDGYYLSDIPENPFNELRTIRALGNEEEFPTDATGSFGWIYKPATRDFRIDWPGTDSKSIRYYDY